MDRKHYYISTIDPNAHFLAQKYGLGLEIAEYCTAWNMDVKFRETHETVRKRIEGIPNRILHAPFNELFPCAIDLKARELAGYRYRQAIGLAQTYGAEKVVIHGGYHPWIYYPVWYTEQSVVFWKTFLKDLPAGITVCLENVLEEEPGMLLDIVREIKDPRLKLCLDIGHVNAYSKVSPMEWLEVCAPFVSHFHIHNNDGSWDTHSPLEQGSIPVRELLKRAEILCPDATCTLELMNAERSVCWLLEE